jgi:hypothetical protein
VEVSQNHFDNIILTASSTTLLRRTISTLQWEFAMKDLESLHHFLGITVKRHPDGMFLHFCAALFLLYSGNLR